MVVGVDIDNCCNNLTECVLRVYNEDSGDNLQLSDITEYGMEKFVKEEYKKDFYKYFLDKRVWKQVEITPNAVSTIKALHEEGHNIIFITTTWAENLPKKKSWLSRHFPFLDIQSCLYAVPKKQMIICDVLIDDCYDNLHGGRYVPICYNQAWNKDCEIYHKVSNWNEVYNKIQFIDTYCFKNDDIRNNL